MPGPQRRCGSFSLPFCQRFHHSKAVSPSELKRSHPPPFPTMLFIIKTLLIKLLIAAGSAGIIYALC